MGETRPYHETVLELLRGLAKETTYLGAVDRVVRFVEDTAIPDEKEGRKILTALGKLHTTVEDYLGGSIQEVLENIDKAENGISQQIKRHEADGASDDS